jgi:hypothetical protein
MRDESRSAVDDEIDDVARALTAVPPPGDFRTAIHSRLRERRRDGVNSRWYGAAAAAAALIGLIIVLSQNERPDTSTPRENVVTETAVSGPRPVAPPASDGPVSLERYREPRRVLGQTVQLDEPTPITDPLTVESLELPPLDVDGIDVPTLSVETLRIDPVSLQ